MSIRRSLCVAGGVLCVALGTAGIVLPLLPTTPFLLLSAYLFSRSSESWHRWLIHHRYFGPYIRAFREKTGLTGTQKLRIGISTTLMIGVSVYFAPINAVRFCLVAIWLMVAVMLYRMKTASPSAGATASPTGSG
ncbi:MAG: YbaN family protein [Planctomycetes bacterium]|nr:YbaN family protein [Planctomycetota bacterium]